MSARVDVLAVLDLAACRERDSGMPDGVQVAARAVVAESIEALRKAEATIAASLQARGYQPGSCTDDWEPACRAEVATLAEIRTALGRIGAAP